jgi:glycosyltransferase involved in cell wall biosynthesis
VRQISIVVPVFNAASTLVALVERLDAVLRRISSSHEIILVNDGSSDDSWSIIGRLTQRFPEIIGLDLGRNHGQQNALLAGIYEASGEVIVTIDDDLDYRPEDMPLLLDAFDRGHDVVYGRHSLAAGGPSRRIATKVARLLVRRVSPWKIGSSAFRVFDRSLRDRFARVSPSHASLDVLIDWAATQPTSVQLPPAGRSSRTRYGWRALVSIFSAALVGLTVRPLQLAGWIGALLLGIGTAGMLTTLCRDAPSTTALILSALSILTGIQCLLLAVLGAYIGRIYFINLEVPRPGVRARIGGRPRAAREAVR